MHTVRNRKGLSSRAQAARERAGRDRAALHNQPAQDKPPSRPPVEEAAFMLRPGTPAAPGFPADLIVPPHRGAVITPASWPQPAVPLSGVRRSTGKAARKAARRAAAQAEAQAATRAATAPVATVALHQIVALSAAEPVEPARAPARPLSSLYGASLSALPDHEPIPVPAPIAAMADARASPDAGAPGRALAVRRQGFIDILAFALRDSGRRLARWSSARRRADDMKDKLARAEARMRAMEAQLAALRALQERVR
ncbi:hypothetical protein [Novosphingobium sp.]|uniref:hypothetical protein n=1 Tax=Novosphingobium sp. TaxID=1874826 RepID=UPI003340C802